MPQVAVFPYGSERHAKDVESLIRHGAALPYGYLPGETERSAWWCRVSQNEQLLSAVVIERSGSRAVPGALVLRIERFGRALHEPIVQHLGSLAGALQRLSRRTLVIQLALFDEDRARRTTTREAFERHRYIAGHSRSYSRTLRIDLCDDESAILGSFSQSARRGIRAFANAGGCIRRIIEPDMSPWFERLYRETFTRTGGTAPSLSFVDVIRRDPATSRSALFAAFASEIPSEDGLVAFGLVRGHGDYATYEAGGSRAARGGGHEFNAVGGYPVMWECVRWAAQRGCSWFDMGGSIDESIPGTHALHGIEEFKRRFSKSQVDVAEELTFEPSRTLSALAATSRMAARQLSALRQAGR